MTRERVRSLNALTLATIAIASALILLSLSVDPYIDRATTTRPEKRERKAVRGKGKKED